MRVSLIYLALEELDTVFKGRWLWSTRRPSIARFRRQDYLGNPAEDLRESVKQVIAAQGGNFSGGPIRLLTHLRYWGFGFNPVSFYYCFSKDDSKHLEYIVAEVTNTPWGQRHAYVLDRTQFNPLGPISVPKVFHVSPFMPMDMSYQFRLTSPDNSLLVHMANFQGAERPFDVTMKLQQRPLTTWNLARVLWRYPTQTLQVVGQIYLQAFRLWWKKVPFVPHPQPGRRHGNLIPGTAAVNLAPKLRLNGEPTGEAGAENAPVFVK